MRRRIQIVIRIINILSVLAVFHCGLVGHPQKVDATYGLEFGQPLGSYNNVSAYSNYDNTAAGYKSGSDYTNYVLVNGQNVRTGQKWQCVEYVCRYYAVTYGMDIRGDGGNANSYYNNAASKGLSYYPNNTNAAPMPGDILVSEYSDGHVAIVRGSSSNGIHVIHQNWSNTTADNDKTVGVSFSNGNYLVHNFGDNYTIRGWLRCPKPVIKTSWEFNTVATGGDPEGWESKNVESWSVGDSGYLYINPTVNDPWIQSPLIQVDTSDYNTVNIRMSSNCPDGNGYIYFKTATSDSYSEDKKVRFTVNNQAGGSAGWREYPVYMGSHTAWSGTVTGLRIDPADHGSGSGGTDGVGFDYIRLSNTSPANLGLQPSSGWDSKQLYMPYFHRNSDQPGTVTLGVQNKRDMWYLVTVYLKSDNQLWHEMMPQPFIFPYLSPYGAREFVYTPKAGEQIKLSVRNDLNDSALRSIYTLDFATRSLLGISISPPVTDQEDFMIECLSFYNDFLNIGAEISLGHWKDALSKIGKNLASEIGKQKLVELLGKAGVQTTVSQVAAKSVFMAYGYVVNVPVWWQLWRNTNKEPFDPEEVIFTPVTATPPATFEPRITSGIKLLQNGPYYVGQTINAQFSIVNRGAIPATVDILTLGGRGPKGNTDVRDFSHRYGITLAPNVPYQYTGELKLLAVGQYHFFCAYHTMDGQWNCNVLTESGSNNTLDIVSNSLIMPVIESEARTVADVTPPSVSISGPATGETIAPGSSRVINWSVTDDVNVLSTKLYYTTDGWSTFTEITPSSTSMVSSTDQSRRINATSYGAVDACSWFVPSTTTDKAAVKIVATDSAGNVGSSASGFFNISNSILYPDLNVSNLETNTPNPAPGQQITVYTTVLNQGDAPSPASSVKLYLSRTASGRDNYLGNCSVPTLPVGSSLRVDKTVSLPSTVTGPCYITAVVNPDNLFGEKSTANNSNNLTVTIQDDQSPTITYLQLQWGHGTNNDIFMTGHEYTIVFTADDNVGISSADFLYTTNGGSTWTPIATNFVIGSNNISNGYRWTIPANTPLTSNGQVKMVARDASNNTAVMLSDTFTLINGTPPGITVISPNGGEIWNLGSTHEIKWSASSANSISRINIWLVWYNTGDKISEEAVNDGTYTWQVPVSSGFATTVARIKITVEDSNGNISEDYSDSYFTLKDASQPPSAPWTTPVQLTSIPPGELQYASKENYVGRLFAARDGSLHLVYKYVQDDWSGIVNSTGPRIIRQEVYYKKLSAGVWSNPQLVYTLTHSSSVGDGLAGYINIRELNIAADNNGNPHLVWTQGPGGFGAITNFNQDEIYYTSRSGSTWSTPINISTNSSVSDSPAVSLDSNSNVHLAWRDGTTYNPDNSQNGTNNIYYKRKDSSTGAWSAQAQLTSGGAGWLSITSDMNGKAHLAYSMAGKIYYAVWNGTSWGDALEAIPDTVCYQLRIVSGNSNSLHIAWTDQYRDASNNLCNRILYSTYNGISWSPPAEISDRVIDGNYPANPALAVDVNNLPHVTWENNSNGYVLYKRKTSIGWSTRTKLNLDSQFVNQGTNQAAVAGNGRIYVLWANQYSAHSELFYNHADVSADIIAPSITITAPVQGDQLSMGDTRNITWSSQDNVAVSSVSIEYSIDNGINYLPVVANQGSSGSFTWTVPNVTSDKVRIKAIAVDTSNNIGYSETGCFSISDRMPPVIIVLTPASAGESWSANSTQNIRWQAIDNVGVSQINLQYSVDDGASWQTIALNQSNTGSYAWPIPNTPSSTCRVKVSAVDAANNLGSANSSYTFTIISVNHNPNVPGNLQPANKASSVTLNTTLSWSATDPDAGQPVVCDVYFGEDANPPLIATGISFATYQPGTLEANTLYFWRIVASDSNGLSSTSPIWSFMTEPASLPAPPASLVAANQANGQVGVTWTATSGSELGYKVNRKVNAGGTYSLLDIVPSGVNTYNDFNTAQAGTYYYKVSAYNYTGDSNFSPEANITIQGDIITNSTADSITPVSARLNGNISGSPGQSYAAHVCWGTSSGGTTPANWEHDDDLGTISNGVFYHSISNLSPASTYYYRCYVDTQTGLSWAPQPTIFNTLNLSDGYKLVGADDVTPSGSHGANYLLLTKWTATASGNLNQVKVKCGAPGKVKVAVYADSSGAPGELRGVNNVGQAVVSGWNTINLSSPVLVSSGTTYWLAFISDSACVNYVSGSGTLAYKAASYSSSFPDPAGTGFTNGAYYSIAQGWGTTPLPPMATSFITPGSAITFKWNAAERADNYHLQVNTLSGFNGTDLFNAEAGNVTTREVSGLMPGTTYYWRVKAGNAAGWSGWAATRSILAGTVP